jgi:hypothetical protein
MEMLKQPSKRIGAGRKPDATPPNRVLDGAELDHVGGGASEEWPPPPGLK